MGEEFEFKERLIRYRDPKKKKKRLVKEGKEGFKRIKGINNIKSSNSIS